MLLHGTLLFCPGYSKVKLKAYLGLLTLPEQYEEEKNQTGTDKGMEVPACRSSYELNNPDRIGRVIFYAANERQHNK